jgi:hypothetical protein
MSKQPEALRLAYWLERDGADCQLHLDAAVELRRLYALHQALEQALEQAARQARDTDRLAALMPRAINALVRVEAMLRGAHLNSNATTDEIVAVINEWREWQRASGEK